MYSKRSLFLHKLYFWGLLPLLRDRMLEINRKRVVERDGEGSGNDLGSDSNLGRGYMVQCLDLLSHGFPRQT